MVIIQRNHFVWGLYSYNITKSIASLQTLFSCHILIIFNLTNIISTLCNMFFLQSLFCIYFLLFTNCRSQQKLVKRFPTQCLEMTERCLLHIVLGLRYNHMTFIEPLQMPLADRGRLQRPHYIKLRLTPSYLLAVSHIHTPSIPNMKVQ